MNAVTLFALLLCAVVAMVSGVPSASEDLAPAELPVDDLFEGAESRGYRGYRGYHVPRYYGGGRGGYHHRHYGHGR